MARTLDELKERVSLVEYVQGQGYELKRVGAGTYRINPCPACGGQDHFTINENGNYFNSFSCDAGGSIIDWFTQVEEIPMNEAIDKLYSLAGEERPTRGDGYMREEKKTPSQPQPSVQPQPNICELDFTDYITKAHEATIESDDLRHALQKFCLERGISVQQIYENKIAVIDWRNQDTGAEYKRVILPVWKGGKVVWYTRRALDAPEGEVRFMDAAKVAKSEAIFNIDYLDQQHDQPIFLTESIIDAMNLETLEYKAIAINSTENLDKFIEKLKRSKARNTVLIGAFDNDEAGRKGTRKILEMGYHSIKKPCIKRKMNKKGALEDVTDINDWFMDSFKTSQKSPQDDLSDLGIKLSIDRQIALRGRTDNVESYLEFDMLSDLKKISAYKDKKTGFENLDKKMNGLQVGLYVVGGVSSVGKTTFVHQLTDQLAEQGDHVLYFSLEQSKLEMVTKSLARTSAKLDMNKAISSIAIRSGVQNEHLSNSITEYKKYAKNMSIIEGNFETNVTTIQTYIQEYIQLNGVRPVVVIDYLQIMPPMEKGMSDKTAVDVNVRELKRMSHREGVPIFVISSFNRASYLAPVSFESFKESGGIEYTADVVWGLQMGIISTDEFTKLDKLPEKIALVNKAKAEEIRDIELVCLKNRNGSLFTSKFSYYAKHDYYQPNEGLGGFTTASRNEKGERIKTRL